MDANILKIAATIAGIGGLSVGGLIIIFKRIIAKKIFPTLTKQQAYKLLTLIVILCWSVALAGIGSWTYTTLAQTLPKPESGETIKSSEAPGEPAVNWLAAAEEARSNGTVHPSRPLPIELTEKRTAFEKWWRNSGLEQRKALDTDVAYKALSYNSRLYRMSELQSESKPSANYWADQAITFFEQTQNSKYLVESLLDKAAIYLELSQIEHTDPESFREIAKDGDTVMAHAATLAKGDQKADAYRLWSRFYYNLSRPSDGDLSQNWDNNYLLLSFDKMSEAYKLDPDSIMNANQLARTTQKAAANPPQDSDPIWTDRLRDIKTRQKSTWDQNQEELTSPSQRIPGLQIQAVITMDTVRREWRELDSPDKTVSNAAIGELEEDGIKPLREVLALVRHTEWEEDYDFDISYDLARVQSVLVQILDETEDNRAGKIFEEAKKNFIASRQAATVIQASAALSSIDGDPSFADLAEERKEALRSIMALKNQ